MSTGATKPTQQMGLFQQPVNERAGGYMKVESKFLSGDVRINGVKLTRAGLMVTGRLKEMLPVAVTLVPSDAIALGRAVLGTVLPPFLRDRLTFLG